MNWIIFHLFFISFNWRKHQSSNRQLIVRDRIFRGNHQLQITRCSVTMTKADIFIDGIHRTARNNWMTTRVPPKPLGFALTIIWSHLTLDDVSSRSSNTAPCIGLSYVELHLCWGDSNLKEMFHTLDTQSKKKKTVALSLTNKKVLVVKLVFKFNMLLTYGTGTRAKMHSPELPVEL